MAPRVCSSAEPGTKGSLYAKHLSSEVQIRHWSVRFEAQPVCTEPYRIGARRNEWAVHGCTTALSVHFTEKWAIPRQTGDREASFYRPRHLLERVRPDQSRWFWSPAYDRMLRPWPCANLESLLSFEDGKLEPRVRTMIYQERKRRGGEERERESWRVRE